MSSALYRNNIKMMYFPDCSMRKFDSISDFQSSRVILYHVFSQCLKCTHFKFGTLKFTNILVLVSVWEWCAPFQYFSPTNLCLPPVGCKVWSLTRPCADPPVYLCRWMQARPGHLTMGVYVRSRIGGCVSVNRSV